MRPEGLRAAGLAVAAIWFASLACPFQSAGGYGQVAGEGGRGYLLALWGWLGPLEGAVAWYGNLPLGLCILRLLRGRTPGRRSALIGLCLAGTVLLPHFIYDFETDGRLHAEIYFGAAVWLWLLAFAVTAGIAWLDGAGRDDPPAPP